MLPPSGTPRPIVLSRSTAAAAASPASPDASALPVDAAAVPEALWRTRPWALGLLLLALAGTVVTALALGGGGFYRVSHEREKRAEERAARAEQTRSVVEAAYGESIEFGQAGKPEEALASARRAMSVYSDSRARSRPISASCAESCVTRSSPPGFSRSR